MRTLWAASLRHLLRHPAQLSLALSGLALGVATIMAVDVATASAGRAFELSLDAVNGAATHEIVGGPGGIDERLYVALRTARLGIESAPIVEGYVNVGDHALQLLGVDPSTDSRVRGHSGPAGQARSATLQAWYTQRGTLLMAAKTARSLGLTVGQAFIVTISGRPHPAKLLATLEAAGAGYDSLVLTDIAQAQEWLGMLGHLSRIELRIPERATKTALERLRAALPPGLQLRETQRRARQSLDMSRAFTVNLQAMSLLALLVGVFLIYSAVSFAIVQRRHSFGVLRALGATRAQVVMLVVTETVGLAIVGSLVGILLGTAIGRELIALVSRTLNDLYFVVAVNAVVLPPASLAKAVAAGFGVSLAAALLPALEVANSAPQLGLRRSSLERRAVNLSRWLLLASVVFAGVAGALVWATQRSLLAGFAALFLLLLAAAALAPAVLHALANGAAQTASRFSPTMRLAFADVAASLSRTGVAVAALGIAVAAMIGVGIMVESFRESLHAWLERSLRADFYVSAPGAGFARPERRIDPAIIERLLAVPGVAAHSESRRVTLESSRGAVSVDALKLAPASYAGIELIVGQPATVWPAFAGGAIVISEPLAWRLHLSTRDTLAFSTPYGARRFPIAGIYRDYGNDRGNVLMSRKLYSPLWQDDAVTAVGIYLAPAARADHMADALRAAAAGVAPAHRQALFIRSNEEIRALSMLIFERTFVITRVLYWLAAGVAAIALVSALLAWQLERSRELAMVRSLGLTPRGVALLIETQTLFMGLAAFLAAVPAGLLTAMLLVAVINQRAFGWRIELHLHGAQFSNALLLALAAAASAGLYPAWRSARMPLAREMREE